MRVLKLHSDMAACGAERFAFILLRFEQKTLRRDIDGVVHRFGSGEAVVNSVYFVGGN